MASGAVALSLGFVGSTFLLDPKKNRIARGQTSGGSWDSPVNQPSATTTIHAALLSNGKVLWIQGSGYHNPYIEGPFKHGIWNPDGTFSSTTTIDEDLFCCGMATLANGNVLLAGGTFLYDGPFGAPRTAVNGKYAGAWFAYEADFSTGSIGRRSEMAHGRWYPTCVELPDGKVCVVQGWDEYGTNNRLVEFYDPQDLSWTIRLDPAGNGTWCAGQTQEAFDFSSSGLPPAGSQCYGPGTAPYLTLYPRMHLMPSGLIACVGMGDTDRMYNPNTYSWVSQKNGQLKRHYAASVLLPLQNTTAEKGKILLTGGSPQAPEPSTNTCEIAEPSGATGITRRSTSSMTYARKHVNPVILPTGEVVIFGGNLQQSSGPLFQPEAFDPVTEQWEVWAAASVARIYHSVALLLHDGRVWTAGSTPNPTQFENRIEIFNPWYVSETRPVISGVPIVGSYGETIVIPTPNAQNISKVSLLKVSSTTHHYNTDQRLIWLQILSSSPTSVTVRAPINSELAPPGMYLLHVLDDASKPIPSVGTYVQIPGAVLDTTPPAQVTGLVVTPNGSSQLNLSWTANTEPDLDHYNVYRGDTPGFSIVPGVTPPTEVPVTNSFSDTGLNSSTTYYYRVAAVDKIGNIGQLSDEASASTSGASYSPIYSVPVAGTNYGKMYTGNLVRVGEFMHKGGGYNSSLVGQSVKKVKVYLKKSGSPTGMISIVVRNSGGSIVHTFGTVDAVTLTTSDQTIEREASTSYTIAANDRILVEWPGNGTTTAQVWVRESSNSFDGANTKWSQFKTSYSNQGSYDLAGEWYKLA